MQTFLPSYDLAETAKVLDNKRLWKQVIECEQLFYSLTLPVYGWKYHPASVMWQGCEQALVEYGLTIALECSDRGVAAWKKVALFEQLFDPDQVVRPVWWGDPRVTASHRAALLAKMPEHYGQFGWAERPGLNYYWPKPGRED